MIRIGGTAITGSLFTQGKTPAEFPKLYMVYAGNIAEYSLFERVGVAYAEVFSGAVVEVAEDLPTYEYISGSKQYSSYAGTSPYIAETVNQPNLKLSSTEKKPWVSQSLDPVPANITYGLEGLFNGVGDGVDLFDGWDFTVGWSALGTATVIDSNTFSTSGAGGVTISLFTIGKVYEIDIDWSSIIDVQILNNTGAGGIEITTAPGIYRFTAVSTGLYIRNISAGTTDTVTILSREVPPATGRVIFAGFKAASIATDIDLLFSDTDVRYLWIEATTGLIKATDGVNTAVSNTGVAIDTPYDFYLAWNADEMWITIAGSKGVVSVFSGSFPVIGDYLKYTDSGVYHRVNSIEFKKD